MWLARLPIRILRIGVSALTHVVSEMSAALLDSRSAEGWLDSNPATSLYDYRMMHSFWVASLALLSYEILVTFDDEIDLMWGGRFVWTRILYFVNRYLP
ncbi:hypothetical protein C8Q72DRAFT_853150 [Fomitopsis betulina]|nr:hypothetical protein C8Q72DRAFT_853150 [Fomitopsis betulina]